MSAPHVLPLADGQSVPMRAWWRHWGISTAPNDGGDEDDAVAAAASAAQPPPPPQLLHAGADEATRRAHEIDAHLSSGLDQRIVDDWEASRCYFKKIWATCPNAVQTARCPGT